MEKRFHLEIYKINEGWKEEKVKAAIIAAFLYSIYTKKNENSFLVIVEYGA